MAKILHLRVTKPTVIHLRHQCGTLIDLLADVPGTRYCSGCGGPIHMEDHT